MSGKDATNKIIGYYSYLFSFPSHGVMMAVIAAMPAAASALGFALALGLNDLWKGLIFGVLGITAPIFLSDALALHLLKGEDYMTPRKVTILSYSSCLVYAAFILSSSLIVKLTGFERLLERSIIFAIGLNTFLRHLAITVFSGKSLMIRLIVTFFQPVLLLSSAFILIPIQSSSLILGLTGMAILVGGSQVILWAMGRWEDEHHGLRLLPLFRSFIVAWADKLSGPLEEQITRMGEVRDLRVDSLIFHDERGACKAGLIIPHVHPGPFRDVGSSSMPLVLAERLGKKLDCEVLVSHGISTHKLDLTRHEEIEKIVEAVSSDSSSSPVFHKASDVVWARREGAQASCQMFGEVALLTLTLSPKSYDDLPEELGQKIRRKAEEMGSTAVIIDSHNSIQSDDELDDADTDNLYDAAVEAMVKAGDMPQREFSAGVGRIVPGEWGLEDGMGPCGVAALVVRPEEGRAFAYVVLDGNNMVSGLRERMLSELKSRMPTDAEILTSDTHLVNAIGATTRGYYPLGERTDEKRLTEYAVRAVEEASSRLTKCSASYNGRVVPQLTVLGEAGLNLISEVLESAFSLFKRVAIVSTSLSLILAVIVVFLL